jgi:lipoprotein LprG
MRVTRPQPALAAILTILLAACAGRSVPLLPPEEIIERSAEAMGSLTGFHFLIERSGAPAFLSEQQSISLRRVEGDFAAPDRARAAVRVIAPGAVLDVQAISLDGRYWETNPFSGQWQEYPAEQGFNPAVLFAPDTGIPAMLHNDLSRLSLIGVVELEDLPGLDLYAIEGRMDGRRIYTLSYGLIGPGMIEVKLWIEPGTFYLQRMTMHEPGEGGGEASVWSVDLWNFGERFEIRPPDEP